MDYSEPPKVNFVRVFESSKRRRQNILLGKVDKKTKKGNAANWTEFPNLKILSVPKGWKVEAPYTTPGVISASMNPANKQGICGISIVYMSAAVNFPTSMERRLRKQLFRSPPHELTKDEQKRLPRLLQDYSNFSWNTKIVSCRTLDWNGKKAVYLEAERPATDTPVMPARKLCAVIVDPTEEGYDTMTIQYAAEKELYDRYKPEAMQAMRSIEWKPMEKTYADRTDED